MRYFFLRAGQRLRAIQGLYYHVQALRRASRRYRDDPDYPGSTAEFVAEGMCMVHENWIIQLWYGKSIDDLNNEGYDGLT